MAGQIQLETRYYPADFGVITEPLTIPASGTLVSPVLFADRALLIDDVKLYVSGGVTLTNAVSIKIKQVASPTAPTFVTTAQDVGSFTQLAAAATTAATQTLTFTKTNNSVDNNFVPANSWVWIQTNGTAGAALNVVVQIRFRSQI